MLSPQKANDGHISPSPVVPIGKARLSQLCREDKAKVAKLIAQVTKLRHEAMNTSQQVSSDSLALDTSSSSSLSAAALKVQEKLEHEVNLAQQRLEVLQQDNTTLNGQTEMIRTKYARSLEMLKQYQDRLVKLSEEKEDANNVSRAMQASESAASSRLLELEGELQKANEKVSDQQELVDMHATIEQKQEIHVRELETKLILANKLVQESKTAPSRNDNNGDNGGGDSSSRRNNSSSRNNSSNSNSSNINNSNSSSSSKNDNDNDNNPTQGTKSPSRSPNRHATNTYSSPYSQNRGNTLKRPRSKSPERPISTNSPTVLSSLMPDFTQQLLRNELTPRTQARKRLTEVTKEVVSEIENELEKAHQTVAGMKEEEEKKEEHQTTEELMGTTAATTTTTPPRGTKKARNKRANNVADTGPPTVNSIAHVKKIYGTAPKVIAAPPLSKSVSPDRTQFLRSSKGRKQSRLSRSSKASLRGSSRSSRASSRGSSRASSRAPSKSPSRAAAAAAPPPTAPSSSSSSSSSAPPKTNLSPRSSQSNPLAHSSKDDLLQELQRAQAALAVLKLEQAKVQFRDSIDISEPQMASPERRHASTATKEKQQQQRRRRRRRPRRKTSKRTEAYVTSISPPMHVSVSPKLSDSINFYDGTSLLDVIEAVEDHGSGDLSLSSIGFEDDELDDVSVNVLSTDERGGYGGGGGGGGGGNTSPVLYIAAAPHPSSKTNGRKRRSKKKEYKNKRSSEGSSASALWSSVGKYLNNHKGRGPLNRPRRTVVERHGGREGDYWGAYPMPTRTPTRFSRQWEEEDRRGRREEEEEERQQDDEYQESCGSSKGEPVYR